MKTQQPKKLTAIAIDRSLVALLDYWRAQQDVEPSRVACVEAAVREFLEKRKKAKAKAK